MKALRLSILTILLLLSYTSKAQKDSVEYYLDLAWDSMDPTEKLMYCESLIKHAGEQKDTAAMLDAYSLMGWSLFYLNEMDSALQCYWKQYNMATEYRNDHQQGKALYNLAGINSVKLNYQESIRLYRRAVTLFSMAGDTTLMALVYRDMATNCLSITLFESALDNLNQAMEMDRLTNNRIGLSSDYATKGEIYSKMLEEDFSLEPDVQVIRKQLEIFNNCLDSIPMLIPSDADEFDKLTILAQYHKFKSEYELYSIRINPTTSNNSRHLERASYFNDQFLQIAQQIQDDEYIIHGKIQKSEIEWLKGHREIAMKINDSLKNTLNDITWPTHLTTVYLKSAEYNTEIKNYEQAIADYQAYNRMRRKTMNDKVIRANAEFRSDVRQQENLSKYVEEHDRDRAMNEREVHRQKIINRLILLILFLVLIAAVVIWRSLKNNRKTLSRLREINSQLSQKQDEISSQRDIINEQKDKVVKARNIILESISYARQIQQAALPSSDTIKKIFPDSFVFYKPKDIVSGDFYYVSQNAGWNIFILGDCTGHGVPGGFLSMLGISALQEILRDPDTDMDPAEILDRMRSYIKRALSNNDESNLSASNGDDEEEEFFSSANGMDMTVLEINNVTQQLRFGAAYQNLHIVRNGQVQRIKGDHMPVARHIKGDLPFNSQTMDIQKGDMIYLTSDGIASQINSQNQKFMSKRLNDFFKENHSYACKIQNIRLSHLMDEWCKDTIQVDDMCLVGIRIV